MTCKTSTCFMCNSDLMSYLKVNGWLVYQLIYTCITFWASWIHISSVIYYNFVPTPPTNKDVFKLLIMKIMWCFICHTASHIFFPLIIQHLISNELKVKGLRQLLICCCVHTSYFETLLCYNLPDKQENWVCVKMDGAEGVIHIYLWYVLEWNLWYICIPMFWCDSYVSLCFGVIHMYPYVLVWYICIPMFWCDTYVSLCFGVIHMYPYVLVWYICIPMFWCDTYVSLCFGVIHMYPYVLVWFICIPMFWCDSYVSLCFGVIHMYPYVLVWFICIPMFWCDSYVSLCFGVIHMYPYVLVWYICIPMFWCDTYVSLCFGVIHMYPYVLVWFIFIPMFWCDTYVSLCFGVIHMYPYVLVWFICIP